MNLATLVVGLAIATALWSGVQALNAQARASYDRAAAVLGQAGTASLVSAQGVFVRQDDYVALRRAGWQVSPVIEGTVRLGAQSYRLVGVEPLTAPSGSPARGIATGDDLGRFIGPPGQTLVAPEMLGELGVAAGATPRTEREEALPPLVAAPDVAPGLLVVDIGVAQRVLGRAGQITRLVVTGDTAPDAETVKAVVGDALRLEQGSEGGDLARLTDSFHLNLTAFGLLAFIVGLFIVHASVGLAFEQRLGTVRTMRAVGVPLGLLMAVLVGEVVLLALIAGALGMVAGYFLAAALLPDVAASLDSLYGAHVAGALNLSPLWWLSGLGMALGGALAASLLSLIKMARLPVLVAAKPLAWRDAQTMQLRWQGVVAACAILIALGAFVGGQGLVAGFVVIAGVLLGAALLLPLALSAVLRVGEAYARGALQQWFWADARLQLSGLSLALMALLLALAANVGVGTMVEGFRKTFTGWLDGRLNSEIYFDAASAADGERVARWLGARSEVTAVLPVWRAETRVEGWPVEVVGTRDHATYRAGFSLLSAVPDAFGVVHAGRGVLVSEQLARRLGVGVGDRLAIPGTGALWDVPVVGVYADYGNPKGQVRVDIRQLVHYWPEARRTGYSVRADPDRVDALIDAMRAEFGPALARVLDQASLKAMSTRIFDRTFAVTGALNTLTLVVSGIALFASLLALGNQRLAQIAPVWALGVPRRRLGELEIGRLLVLAAITEVLAVPLGLLLAWCLVAIVNVQAFGWRLPFHVFPAQWIMIVVLALATALAAALVPVVRLRRSEPQDLLRVFANES
ncbi:FtsX-like permease family protein [Hyphomicrobium sp. CS1GBMeth3]|uniref:FtsX-like permease family protein n=1 Tax=Hyphomicrobium sp. CS1GBMeth3 TaxID=1892845 RepID=UPI0009F99E8D|nr:FtsX-like permease family protein [Hyphomicrobium sp. CS1GBMeth3]